MRKLVLLFMLGCLLSLQATSATINVDISSGCEPLKTAFKYDAAVQPATVYWIFGDGSTSDNMNITHFFMDAGVYTVQLYLYHTNQGIAYDSATTTITVYPKQVINLKETICEGQSVIIGNQVFNETGNYSVLLQSIHGCDSTINLSLTVDPNKTTNLSQTICEGDSVTIGNQSFTQEGNYSVTLQSASGCDSIVNLDLTVTPKDTTNLTSTICEGQSVTIGNRSFNETGNYSVTLQGENGCDSIVNLDLVVVPNKIYDTTAVICAGENVTIGQQTFTESGDYSVVLQSSEGCDSTVNLHLTVNPTYIKDTSVVICEGDSVGFGDSTYYETGDYTIIMESSIGCDSTINLHLTVNPNKSTTLDQTICEGDSVTVGNQVFSEAGEYNIPLESSTGCDSTVVLNLTVNPKKTTDTSATICEGESVTIGNQTFNESGNYSVIFQGSNGCDSIVNLNLTVNPNKQTDTSVVICEGESVTFGESTYDETGNYDIHYQTSTGCDSIMTLHLTVNPKQSTNLSQSICEGDSVTIGQEVFMESGNYTVELQTSTGCDSTVNLNLTVNPKQTTDTVVTVCAGESVTIGNQTFDESGDYEVTLQASTGCDSTVNLHLSVNPTYTKDTSITICEGESVTFGESTYSETGNYSIPFQTALGCDSSINLHLTVNPKQTTNLDESICEGESVTVGEGTYSETGNYTIVLESSTGCDSTVNLNLMVNPKKFTDTSMTICEGDSVTIGAETFTESGEYSVVLQSSAGCDSTVNLNLTVNPKKTADTTITICEGESITFGETTYTESGEYALQYQTSTGCDSIINLHLSVNPKQTTNLNESICEGESYSIGEEQFTVTGNYTVVLSSSTGCDSTVNLNLMVNPKKSTDIARTICPQQSVTIGNETFNEAGEYTVVLQTSSGCDSTVNLNLSVTNYLPGERSETICEGQSVIVGEHTYTETGVYTDTIDAAGGCDSVITLTLTVLEASRSQISESVCEGESVTIGNETFDESGEYTIALQASNSCDSIVTLNLFVNPKPEIHAIADQTIVFAGSQVQLNVETNEMLNYSWSPSGSLNNSEIQNPMATVNEPTVFMVTAVREETGCRSTDTVFVDINTECDKKNIFIPNAFTPNGDHVNDIFLARTQGMASGELRIYDRLGTLVFESKELSEGWDGNYKGGEPVIDAYVYFFSGICQSGGKIELKGTINLLK